MWHPTCQIITSWEGKFTAVRLYSPIRFGVTQDSGTCQKCRLHMSIYIPIMSIYIPINLVSQPWCQVWLEDRRSRSWKIIPGSPMISRWWAIMLVPSGSWCIWRYCLQHIHLKFLCKACRLRDKWQSPAVSASVGNGETWISGSPHTLCHRFAGSTTTGMGLPDQKWTIWWSSLHTITIQSHLVSILLTMRLTFLLCRQVNQGSCAERLTCQFQQLLYRWSRCCLKCAAQ